MTDASYMYEGDDDENEDEDDYLVCKKSINCKNQI